MCCVCFSPIISYSYCQSPRTARPACGGLQRKQVQRLVTHANSGIPLGIAMLTYFAGANLLDDGKFTIFISLCTNMFTNEPGAAATILTAYYYFVVTARRCVVLKGSIVGNVCRETFFWRNLSWQDHCTPKRGNPQKFSFLHLNTIFFATNISH